MAAKLADLLKLRDGMAKAGIPASEELEAKIRLASLDEVFHHLSEKVILPLTEETDNAAGRKARNKVVQAWQDRLVTLAADVSTDFRVDPNKSVGRGKQSEWFASVETPNGTLVVRLRRDVTTGDDDSDKE